MSETIAGNQPGQGSLILDAEALYSELLRGVQRIMGPNTRLAGITSGGAWLVERLHKDLNLAGKPSVLSSALHRDDFAQRGMSTSAQTQIAFDVNGADVLVLDDVLYTGRTVSIGMQSVTPLNLSAGNPLREKFLKDCLEQTEEQYTGYWLVRRYVGKGAPPPELSSVDEVLRYVQDNPGAMGYVPLSRLPRNANVIFRC